MALVPEKFCHRQCGQSDAQTRSRWFVHLAENHSYFRLRQILLIDHAGLAHFSVKIVAFAAPFAHAGEHRNTAVTFSDVVDQLHDDNRFANTGAAKRADLAAFREWTDQVDYLDSGFEDLDFRILFSQLRRGPVNWITLGKFHRAAIIDRIACEVE